MSIMRFIVALVVSVGAGILLAPDLGLSREGTAMFAVLVYFQMLHVLGANRE